MDIKFGITVGNDADLTIELGWIPDAVIVYNATDGTPLVLGFPSKWVIPFSGGGTNEIAAGDTITGVTSGATAVVKQVLLYSGSWAGGDAAGFFVVERDDLVGTFGSENVVGETAGATDDATVTVNAYYASNIAAAVAADNDAIQPYAGVAGSNAKGFTIDSVQAVEAKVLYWLAIRESQ